MNRQTIALISVTLLMMAKPVPAITVILLPFQDTPIYADDGVTTFTFAANSNGAGETLFVGTNGTGSARRSLMQFDLSALPQGSVVTDARLTLFCDREPGNENETLSLHNVNEAWTTGASNSDALGTPGQGAPAEPGDSTWYFRSWPGADNQNGLKWSKPGAAFDATILASTQVGPLSVGGDKSSLYSWSSAAMLASINAWLADANSNFGWIMIGNETQTRSVKRFISSEGRVNNWLKPNLVLTVDIPAGAPATLSLVSSANPADYKQNVDITALILGGTSPTGTVTFKDGENVISNCANVPLSAGQAVCHINKLLAGVYHLTASYSGDAANAAITSKVITQLTDEPSTGNDTTTSIIVTSSNSNSLAGSAVTLTSNVRGGLGPAGTITFMDGSQVLCNAVVILHRTASCTKTGLTQGTHRIVALYSGDGTNMASSSPAITQTVLAACTTASKPILDKLQAKWSVPANQEFKLLVTASDCMGREIMIKSSALPKGFTFSQSVDSLSAKQTGILSWTPGGIDMEKTKTLSFVASVGTGKNKKSTAAQKVSITVLAPIRSVIDDPLVNPAINKVQISKAIWHAKTMQLEVSGNIVWKAGSSRVLRANALSEQVQVLDSIANTVLATSQPNLAGNWKSIISLPSGTTPASVVQAQFRGKVSLVRKVK